MVEQKEKEYNNQELNDVHQELSARRKETTNQKLIIILLVIIALLLGVILYLIWSNSKLRKQGKEGSSDYFEEQRRNSDIDSLSLCMSAAEKVAIDPGFDIGSGTEFEIRIQRGGTVSFTVRCKTESEDAAAAEKEWKAIVGDYYTMRSIEFKTLEGTITGTLSEYGSVSWKGEGISSLTEYSSEFEQKWGL